MSFEVEAGKVMIIAGRNGSGKSTLLRLLGTALRADAGEGAIEGLDLRRERQQVRRRVALLGHASYLYESLTARENLVVFSRFLGLSDRRETILPLLARVGLDQRADDPVRTFSAGMRKRLSLARVLLRRSPVLLLDEPYGQLDPPGFRFMDELISELRQGGSTILMATHQLERAALHGDDALVLEEGRLAWTGPASGLPEQDSASWSISARSDQ